LQLGSLSLLNATMLRREALVAASEFAADADFKQIAMKSSLVPEALFGLEALDVVPATRQRLHMAVMEKAATSSDRRASTGDSSFSFPDHNGKQTITQTRQPKPDVCVDRSSRKQGQMVTTLVQQDRLWTAVPPLPRINGLDSCRCQAGPLHPQLEGPCPRQSVGPFSSGGRNQDLRHVTTLSVVHLP
jgi:hypothetical protein